MKNLKKLFIIFMGVISFIANAEQPGFKRCGFYLHEGWFFNYPFAVRTWGREDFASMFQLLQKMGYSRVGIWPMLEAIPMPLSKQDSIALAGFRNTIEDAHSASLECWLIQCANLTPDPSIAALPWSQRNPYYVWKKVRLDDPEQAEPYLAHRSVMLAILNNADGYVTIDGDPGGYPGAKPVDWLKVFLSDREAIRKFGVNPPAQQVIPWVWCGWGTDKVWGGNANNPPELIRPYTRATMELFKQAMPEPWAMLPGRSHRDGWANGRVNIGLADSLGLMSRSTIFCYEAIEFEPTPPAAVIQFDQIRRILNEESQYAGTADGIFGNAQQPVMALPNIFFFVKGASDLSYLKKSDEQVLTDFAEFLGGSPELLIPAWECLQRNLQTLPCDLPVLLRKTKLKGEAAAYIPGGAERYLEILAQQVESRIRFLKSIVEPAVSDEQASKKIAEGISALVSWWNVHGYVQAGNIGDPFNLNFVHESQVSDLRNWCMANVKDSIFVSKLATKILLQNKILSEQQAVNTLNDLLSKK